MFLTTSLSSSLIYFISETEWKCRGHRFRQHQFWQHSSRGERDTTGSFGFGSFARIKLKRFNREINIACSSNTRVDIDGGNEFEINGRLIEQLNAYKSERRWRLFAGERLPRSQLPLVYSPVNKTTHTHTCNSTRREKLVRTSVNIDTDIPFEKFSAWGA